MKDNFSKLAQQYAKYRPHYPAEIFNYIISLIPQRENAWDCATGNGQIAQKLSPHFNKIFATDISEQQIQHAKKEINIEYRIEPAEETSFPNDHFNLITVGQAIHWFDFNAFYAEVKRTSKNNGLLAVIGYDLLRVDEGVDKVIHHYYEEVLEGFWDEERKYLDEQYKTIPFPFREIHPPEFRLRLSWTREQFMGYLGTWSAAQHYENHHHVRAAEKVIDSFYSLWPDNAFKTVTFPLLLRIGIIEK